MAQRMIAFTSDKHGRPVAYVWGTLGWPRWFRVPYDKAKVAVATGQAREVPYRRNHGRVAPEAAR